LRRATSREFEAFIKAQDLDDLLQARRRLGDASEKRQAAKAVMEGWADPQTVANLLFYPDLLPQDDRKRFVMRALNEMDVPYYRLPAVLALGDLAEDVDRKIEPEIERELPGLETEADAQAVGPGVAELRENVLTPEERSWREEIRAWLFETIEHADEVMKELESTSPGFGSLDQVIAERATAVLPSYVKVEDLPRLLSCLDHRSECVRNNVVWVLVDLVGKEQTDGLVNDAAESGSVSRDARAFVKEKLDGPLLMLWAYMPNLVDVFRAEDAVRRS
jgi:hypothetical protein